MRVDAGAAQLGYHPAGPEHEHPVADGGELVDVGRADHDAGAVAGGLAGLAYGEAAIPAEWLEVLARRADIEDLAARLAGA